MEATYSPENVRARLNEAIASGKTVVLSPAELDDPSLREQLPQLLEDLSAAQRTDTTIGPRIPGYTMLGEIGQGGMSTVYLAKQDKLGRHVAIKIAPSWLGGGDRARRMLVHEAHALARLTHPNIVVIHDIIDVDDTFAIAMEWVDGLTLTGLLRALPKHPHDDDIPLLRAALGTPKEQHGNFEVSAHRHFAKLIHDVARAVQTVHDNEMLHLDIKPSNVLVRRDGTPLLADFGVTRDLSLETDQTRTFAGTPVYAAPEQIRRDDQNIGPHTDVYSLGVTLYEIIARRQPLQGMDVASIAKYIESGSMPKLSSITDVSPDLENIVHKAISPEREHRYQTADEFADDLAAFLHHRPVTARPLGAGQRVRRWARNEPWKAGLALTLAIALPLLIGMGIYVFTQLPSINAANANTKLAKANNLKHQAYQRYFTGELPAQGSIDLLEQAIVLDPGQTSVASLLALANEQGWGVATEIITRHAMKNPSLGMELFAKKVSEQRSFFSDLEVARLLKSTAASDIYLLALDQAFRAHDDHLETSAATAQKYLEAALQNTPQDPLLLGLITWFAVRAEDLDRFETTRDAMWNTWPEDAMALAWAPLALAPSDIDRSKELSADIIKMRPQAPRGYELLAGAESRSENHDKAREILARAAAAKVAPPVSEIVILKISSDEGNEEAIEDRIQYARDKQDLGSEIILTARHRPDDRAKLIEQILALETPSADVLAEAYFAVFDDDELNDAVWERYDELYPDRKDALPARFLTLLKRRDFPTAADLAPTFTSPKKHIHMVCPWKARLYIMRRDYERLITASKRWALIEEYTNEASFYRGVGHARLGQYEEAAKHLATSLHKTVKKTWFSHALLEAALLKCSPDVPEHLRDPDVAKALWGRFVKLNETLPTQNNGPWTHLVHGMVLLANGAPQEAIKVFETGLSLRGPRETMAPKDYRQQLQAALEEAEKQAAKKAAEKKKKKK